MTAHRWTADGVRDLGEPRHRCARCGMLSHWAGARDECPWMDAATVSRLATMDAAAREVQRADTTTSVWEGPYRHNKWKTCKRCNVRFRHPKRFHIISLCGPVCVRENELERGRAYRITYEQRKATRAQERT